MGLLAAVVTPDIKIYLLVRRQNEPYKIVHQFTCYYCSNGSACTYYLNAMIINYIINKIYILYRTCVCIARNRLVRLIAVLRKLYSFFTHRKRVYKTKYYYTLPPEWVIKTQRHTPPLSPRRQPGLFYRRLGRRN